MLAYDEVVPDIVWDLVEKRYAHVGVVVVVERGDIEVVGGFGEEGEGETAVFVGRLNWFECIVSTLSLASGVMEWMLTLMFILKVAVRFMMAVFD